MSIAITITHDYATPTERIPHPVTATVTEAGRMSWIEIDKVCIFGTLDELRDLLDRAHAALNEADIAAQVAK